MVKATRTPTTKPTVITTAPARYRPITGTAILALLGDLIRTQIEHDDVEQGSTAFDAARQVARTLALVPPSTPEEALAAACFLYDEAEQIEHANKWTDERLWEYSIRMRRRAIALAAWIETAHGVDRTELGLAIFCGDKDEFELLPHSPAHPASRDGVAPLRAGTNAAWATV